ncbi:MAG TPA: hypothetical protein VJP80_03240 [Candidatus Saccharimonadales bacterium]|nr:hypothetical protein [Candidatus Saccharimonadales bacterium]
MAREFAEQPNDHLLELHRTIGETMLTVYPDVEPGHRLVVHPQGSADLQDYHHMRTIEETEIPTHVRNILGTVALDPHAADISYQELITVVNQTVHRRDGDTELPPLYATQAQIAFGRNETIVPPPEEVDVRVRQVNVNYQTMLGMPPHPQELTGRMGVVAVMRDIRQPEGAETPLVRDTILGQMWLQPNELTVGIQETLDYLRGLHTDGDI